MAKYLFGLSSRLNIIPKSSNGFAYHVTHGVRLYSIKKHGLLPNMPGVQYETGKVFFATNLASCYSAYGTSIVNSDARTGKLRFIKCFAYSYYQGVCVLRADLNVLTGLGFINTTAHDWEGEKGVPSSSMELFIDGTWKNLGTVDFGRIQHFWRGFYWVTPFLRR